MHGHRTPWAAPVLALLLVACDGAVPNLPLRDGEVGFPDAGPPPSTELELYAIEPAHGPFSGGNVVVLRTSGLDAAAWSGPCASCSVTFGGTPASGARFVDEHRLEVVAPPGDPGPVDVRITQNGAEASLANAYSYDSLSVTPPSGTRGGGTYVSVEAPSAMFDASSEVRFGGAPCARVSIESPVRLTCFTPPGRVGPADVVASGRETVEAPGAFLYEDPLIEGGGLGGGRLNGTIEVSVLGIDGPLEGATVLAGLSGGELERATTDANGLAAIGGPAFLSGPIDLHVVGPCHYPTSIVGLDAARATVSLAYDAQLCPLPMTDPPPQPMASVSGALDVHGWAGVPTGNRSVHIIASSTFPLDLESLDPAGASTYSIAVSPGLVAIVALAGVEVSGTFTPYRMGIRRAVLLAPGDVRSGLDIDLDIPLDRAFHAELAGLPAGSDNVVTADLIIEEGQLTDGWTWSSSSGGTGPAIDVPHLPALAGALADGHYRVIASSLSEDGSSTRMLDVASESVRITDFLAEPSCLEPAMDGTFDGTVRWSTGGSEARMTYLFLSDSDSFQWTIYGPGDLTEVHLPLAMLGVDSGDPGTSLTVSVTRAIGPELDFDSFRYADLARFTHRATCNRSAHW